MAKVTICARFRPLTSSEIREHGTSVSIHRIDDKSFNFKDAKDGGLMFNFDKVFYEDSAQASVYEILALPIVQDAVNGINGTIITYGQTGAGKTYSMEGPGIEKSDDIKKGLVPRVIEGLFEMINSADDATTYSVKLSMVEIYMEKVRDLFDLSKDNIQIKESKSQGILLSGVTEIPSLEAADALQILSRGIANRAVGETQMNVASSRSHCIYVLTVQQDLQSDKRTKTGKLILVDLAGSEKVGKTGAEGRILEEANTINKSLTALGKVVNALTCSSQNKLNHIPYHDSKFTRMLQDALGGSCRMALLCCCSPSSSNASETLSTLRFGARQTLPRNLQDLPQVLLLQIATLLPKQDLHALMIASKTFKIEIIEPEWNQIVYTQLNMLDPDVSTIDWENFYKEAFVLGCNFCGGIDTGDYCEEGFTICISLRHCSLNESQLQFAYGDGVQPGQGGYSVVNVRNVVAKSGLKGRIVDARSIESTSETSKKVSDYPITCRLLPNGLEFETVADAEKPEEYAARYIEMTNNDNAVVMIVMEFCLNNTPCRANGKN